MPRHPLLIAVLLLPLFLNSCSDNTTDSSFTEGKELFYANEIDKAHELLLVAHANDPHNTEVICYLAEASRRLKQMDEAMSLARTALAQESCNSFAHTVLASVYEPMWGTYEAASNDSCWQHALAAVECDPADGNAWLVVWTQALRRGDEKMEQQALSSLIEHEFFSQPVLEFNRWTLENLPKDAVLLTNGDLDTYPAVALQHARGIRPDVAIVNLSLLNTPWYTEYLKARYDLPIPIKREGQEELKPYQEGEEVVTIAMQRLNGWLKQQESGELTRPISISITVFPDNLPPDIRSELRFMGSYYDIAPDLPATADPEQLKAVFDNANLAVYEQPAVSQTDRSPVRRVTSGFGARNICAIGLKLCTALHNSENDDEARHYLEIIEQFAQRSGTADEFSEDLRRLEEKLPG